MAGLHSGRHPYCKACKRLYNQAHYRKNKARYLQCVQEKKRERLPLNRQKIYAYLKAHPCVDCGISDPIVLEFDHLDPAGKTTAVSQMLADYRWERIQKEIDKCVVRCANCHRRRTAQQFGWYSANPDLSW